MEDEMNDAEETYEGPPARLTLLHCFGLVVLLYILVQWVLLILGKKNAGVTDLTWMDFAVVNGIAGLLTAHAGSVLAGFSIPEMLRLRLSTALAIAVVLFTIGLSIVSGELMTLLQKIHYFREPLPIQFFLTQSLPGVLFLVAMVVPLTEELIFRGIMFDGLRESYKTSTALLVSCLLFALVHFHPWASLNAFFLGMLLCWLKLQTESLSACIIAHALYNALPFLVHHFNIKISGDLPLHSTELSPVWFSMLGLGLLVAGGWLIYFLREPEIVEFEEAETPA